MSTSPSSWPEQVLEPLADVAHLEDFLLLLELERQVRGDRVGQPAAVVDAGHRGQDLGRDLLVELDVLVELREQRPAHRLDLVRLPALAGDRGRLGREVVGLVDDAVEPRPLRALDQHLHGAVGQLQHLQHRRHAADRVEILGARVVLGRGLLRDEQDVLAGVHRDVERLDRLRAPDEQRDHHVREDDDVAQRQERQRGHVDRGGGFSGHADLGVGILVLNMGPPADGVKQRPSGATFVRTINTL